jgi:hypothetical protein
VNVQEASGETPFEAVQVTVVVPFGNAEPEAGLQVTVGVGQPAVAVGAVNVTDAEHCPASVLVVMLAGHAEIAGACCTVTADVCVPLSSVADTVPVFGLGQVALAVKVVLAIRLVSTAVGGDTLPNPAVLPNVIVNPFSTTGFMLAPFEF